MNELISGVDSQSFRFSPCPRRRVAASLHPISRLRLFLVFYLSTFSILLPLAAGSEEGDTIVLTAEDIRDMKANKMADVLNHVPGVTAGDRSVGIHGSYKVKIFVDGRPINDPTSSHGGVNWDWVSPSEVEQIEILRGKGGLRYGQDAAGGVILITTRRIRKGSGNIKAYGGSNDTGYAYANLQMSAGKWAMGINGGVEDSDGYKINNDKERRQAGGKLAYAFDEQKTLSLTADYLEDEKGLSGQPKYPTPFSRKSTHTTGASLQLRCHRVTSTTFFNDGRNHNTDPSRGLNQKLWVSEWGEDLAVAMDTGRWGRLNFGGGYWLGKAKGSTFDRQKEETFSAFAAQDFKWPACDWDLTLGLRADINSAFDDALNPEIKASYKKTHWRLTASYGRANNAPSFHQRFNQTSSTRPNPDLTMETSDNYSLALFVEPYVFLSGSVSAFYNRLSDRITYVTGNDGIGQYQNFNRVTYAGGDLALDWHPCGEITIKGSYTYMEAKDQETDLWLPAKAEHRANLDFYWKPLEPLSTVLTSKYVSKVFRNKANTRTVPEYVTADLRAEYAFKPFSLFTEIKNMFDKTYYYADGLLAPPRTWLVGVNWNLN